MTLTMQCCSRKLANNFHTRSADARHRSNCDMSHARANEHLSFSPKLPSGHCANKVRRVVHVRRHLGILTFPPPTREDFWQPLAKLRRPRVLPQAVPDMTQRDEIISGNLLQGLCGLGGNCSYPVWSSGRGSLLWQWDCLAHWPRSQCGCTAVRL